MYNWTQVDNIPILFTAELFTQLHDNAGRIGELRVARGLIEEAIPTEIDFTVAKGSTLPRIETAVNNMEAIIEHINCDPTDESFTAIEWDETTDPMTRVSLWLRVINELYRKENS